MADAWAGEGGGRAAGGAPFGALLRAHRRAAGLTQEALAERAALSARGVQDLERGVNRAPRPETLRLLAAALGLPPEARAALDAAVWPGDSSGSAAARHNLPRPLTSFVGREQDLAAVRRLLDPGAAPGGPRLVTLTGPGGCGKTRLALEVAAGLVTADGGPESWLYPDGAWLVDLAPLAGGAGALPAAVARAALAALGAGGVPSRRAPEGLTDYLRPRTLLLVLDNCEHLLGACARLADALLRACPGLRVLATSREALGLTGECARPVPPLPAPHPAAAGRGPRGEPGPGAVSVRALRRYEAVRLFLDRVATIEPGFVLTGGNAAAVAQICGRLDGLPLALELAAARVRALSVDDIARRLDDRFGLLTAGDRTALPRQQTLRATVDWSHALLSEAERVLLRRLAVFAGGFALDAAEAVAADPLEGPASARESAGATVPPAAVLVLLCGLVEKSLVVAEARPGNTGSAGATRYRLLETIRLYAGGRLAAAGETVAVRGRHLAWSAALAAGYAAARGTPAERPRRARLEQEAGDLRAAVAWGLDREPEVTLRLVVDVAEAWRLRAQPDEVCRWLERGLPQAPARTALRAEALYLAGRLYRQEGEMTRARPLLDESLTIAREAGDRAREAIVLHDQAQLARVDGQTARARGLLAESLTLGRALGHPGIIGGALLALCLLALQERDLAGAKAALRAAAAVARGPGGPTASPGGVVRLWLGTLARLEGDHRRARRLLQGCVADAEAQGHRFLLWSALSGLGDVARDAGDVAGARTAYAHVLGLVRRSGYAMGVSHSLARFGVLAVRQGDYARGARLLAALPPAERARSLLLDPPAYAEGEAARATARAALGPAAFAAAWRAGRAMSPERAVAYALEAAATAPPRPRRDGSARASSRWPT